LFVFDGAGAGATLARMRSITVSIFSPGAITSTR
jgi:hypothetical protein